MGWRVLRNLSVAVFACLLIAGCVGFDRKTPTTLTGDLARSLSAEEVMARALAQLGDNLLPFTPPPSPYSGRIIRDPDLPPPPPPLTALQYASRPRAAYDGWCMMEIFYFTFLPTVAKEATADTPVHVSSVYAQPAFFFLGPIPERRPDPNMTPEETRALQADCARLDPHDPRFISAGSFNDAVLGYWFYREAIAAIIAGNPPFELDCGPIEACQEAARSARLNRNMHIVGCGRNFPTPACYSISTGDVLMDVHLSEYGVRIQKVWLRERVYVTSGGRGTGDPTTASDSQSGR